MASSQANSISLHYRPLPLGYRLIELPPELQSLLESGSSAPVLTLESQPKEAPAILRSPDHTYSIRQKNTSNTLLLVNPTSDNALDAISVLHETIELDLVPNPATNPAPLKNTGSRGKWHEKFGKGR
ncbi:hypothetical protein CDD81_5914 [Ophiocordyceps australis]|uniref:Sister chromatid cohesion protein DCC1 n=1 Tax=Ophiocordyceps australis TaxID=1399860 RepID=A0A2C5YHL3_9HYPO|nr:hypothetical protein CDD81_5914 [Ophiocordyceps australis]